MGKKLKIFGWFLLVVGLLAVFTPHIGFLAGLIPTLDDISHSLFEIVAGVSIIAGLILT